MRINIEYYETLLKKTMFRGPKKRLWDKRILSSHRNFVIKGMFGEILSRITS